MNKISTVAFAKISKRNYQSESIQLNSKRVRNDLFDIDKAGKEAIQHRNLYEIII